MSKHICNFYGVEVTQMVVTELAELSHYAPGKYQLCLQKCGNYANQLVGWWTGVKMHIIYLKLSMTHSCIVLTGRVSISVPGMYQVCPHQCGNQANHIREHPGCYSMDHSSDVLHRWVMIGAASSTKHPGMVHSHSIASSHFSCSRPTRYLI